jgi:hypothetical protein
LCSCDACSALCRTSLLLRRDVFRSDPGADHVIVEGLRATTARIIADRPTASSVGGQTVITTLYGQLAMMGFRIDLDVPDLSLVAPQPPLDGLRLSSALVDYSDDLVPGGAHPGAHGADVVFAVGDEPARGADVRLSWTDSRALVVPANTSVPAPAGDASPLGPVAVAAAAAAEGIRAAVPIIAERLDLVLLDRPAWLPARSRKVDLDLRPLAHDGATFVGPIDAISGGAITHAAIYYLLRVSGLTASVRVIEDDTVDVSNLNRYALARRSRVGMAKTELLTTFSTNRLTISGVRTHLDESTSPLLRPFAPDVLVGVDHIPSRWVAQRQSPGALLCVGSTSHDFVLVSTHGPNTPCAGCAHPRDDDTPGPIPTIAFVSLWAGLVQASLLLAARRSELAHACEAWPLGLDGKHGLRHYVPSANPRCPIGCRASASVRSTSSP